MAKILVLAEKPSVARELARVLGCKKSGEGFLEGERYIVTWALGPGPSGGAGAPGGL